MSARIQKWVESWDRVKAFPEDKINDYILWRKRWIKAFIYFTA